jgi:hypothetical protein
MTHALKAVPELLSAALLLALFLAWFAVRPARPVHPVTDRASL